MQRVRETVMKWVFFISALASILAIALICLFLFVNGIPAIAEIGIFDFLLGQTWKPSSDMY
ncbi:phosphate ABC transporter permease subunit PstC, partial [Ruminococcaceae bacterium OttesenSCG-928-I18]|nr:phosphate ABC transporter permease subunit PstC [Ruminococcaceae bacterium OttesenSCG-928-I18]